MARDLYKMALSIVESCLPEVYSDRLLLLQLLALFNNLGHVHSNCYDEAETNQCMNAARALLASRAFFTAKHDDPAQVFAFFEWSTLSISSNAPFVFAPAA